MLSTYRKQPRFSRDVSKQGILCLCRPILISLELRAQIPDGRFGRARLGDCHLVACLGEDRLVVDKVDIHAMGGLIEGWARVSPREGRFHLAGVIDFNDIDLDEVLQMTASEGASRMVGRLSNL